MQEITRSTVAAEQRAMELLQVCRDACNGVPHWRSRARALLKLIDDGVLLDLPPLPTRLPPLQRDAA